MHRGPTIAILACLISVAVAGCGEAALNPATVPPTEAPASVAAVAGATGFPGESTLPTALGSANGPAATPYPTGINGALLFLQTYENDLIGGRYEAAWAMLAPAYQATIGTYDDYQTERTAFMSIAGRSYTPTANPTDVAPLAELIKGKPFAAAIDQKRVVVLSVQWPTLVRQGTPPEVWLVNPAGGLGWQLYRVR